MEFLHFSHGNCPESGQKRVKEEYAKENVPCGSADLWLATVRVIFTENYDD